MLSEIRGRFNCSADMSRTSLAVSTGNSLSTASSPHSRTWLMMRDTGTPPIRAMFSIWVKIRSGKRWLRCTVAPCMPIEALPWIKAARNLALGGSFRSSSTACPCVGFMMGYIVSRYQPDRQYLFFMIERKRWPGLYARAARAVRAGPARVLFLELDIRNRYSDRLFNDGAEFWWRLLGGWVNWLLLVVLIAVVVIFVFIRRSASSPENGKEGFPYVLGDALFSPAERSFLGVLDQAVGKDFRVFGKVRVADVVAVAKGTPKSIWQRAFNRISAKHFDYVLCRSTDLKPVCVIELNDQSHAKESRKGRDDFLEKVCATAGMPLIFFPAQRSYSLTEVCELIAGALGGLTTLNEAHISNPSDVIDLSVASSGIASEMPLDATNSPQCPRCSSPMVRRSAKSGESAGKKFWGCTKFPACRGTVLS